MIPNMQIKEQTDAFQYDKDTPFGCWPRQVTNKIIGTDTIWLGHRIFIGTFKIVKGIDKNQ